MWPTNPDPYAIWTGFLGDGGGLEYIDFSELLRCVQLFSSLSKNKTLVDHRSTLKTSANPLGSFESIYRICSKMTSRPIWGIILNPQPPHTRQKDEQKDDRKTVEFALFWSIWGHILSRCLFIFWPCMWGAGVTRAFLTIAYLMFILCNAASAIKAWIS